MTHSALRTAHGVATAVGRRTGNEDAFLAHHPVYVVADGMGGHESGELASQAAVAAFEPLRDRGSVDVTDVTACLESAATLVHAIPVAQDRSAGTTLAAVIAGEQDGTPYWLVANLGDSRVYRLTAGELSQVSVDHSEVQELLDSGRLTRGEARDYPRRHVVTRALGPQLQVEPDFWLLPIAPRDRMMICSDGLTSEVDDGVISTVLRAEPDPQRAAESLVAAALHAGGRDNVTVLVVDVVGVAEPSDEENTVPSAPVDDDDRTLPRAAFSVGGRS